MKDTLRTYVCESLIGDASAPVGDEDDLLLSGLVDSVGMMRLVAFVEEAFSVSVPPEDVTIDHFSTISTIVAYLQTRESA